MNDATLTTIAALFEIVIPCSLVAAYKILPKFRRTWLFGLGATTPWVLIYIWVTFGYFAGADDTAFAFHAMWVMSFIPYSFTLALAFILSIWIRSTNQLGSYLLGSFTTFAIVLGAMGLGI